MWFLASYISVKVQIKQRLCEDHKPLRFESKEDLEKYLRGECSETHGFMEYERVPDYVEHAVYYDIDWE